MLLVLGGWGSRGLPACRQGVYKKKVISMWTYRCYDDGEATNLWRRWYDDHPDFRGSHDAIFRILEQRPQWGPPHTKFFNKKERIIEVRLTGSPKHRILGFYPRNVRMGFTVLATCSHKQKVYVPPDIRKIVVKRMKEVLANAAKAPPCDRPS
jgi:hypothetical protein